MAAEMKDVTPKDRVRVQAGREGGPRAEFAPPATTAPTNLPVPAGAEPTNFLAIIARAAADPRTDTAKMQALLDMQRSIEDREAQKAFNRAFIALQEELPTIRQDGKIEIFAKDASGQRPAVGRAQQSTPYATFNNIMKTIKPLMLKHGLELSFSTEPVGERILVRGLLTGHGHQRTTAFPLPAETSGSKNNVQGWGSSMSYGKRYCTIALLNIISEAKEDADTDGHTGNFKNAKGGGLAEVPDQETVDEGQIVKLVELIEWCGIGTKRFCEHYSIAKVADLPKNLYGAAEKACKDYHENQQRKKNG
jgi:ERF superfamily